ncbi:unnamed protein product [Ixodes persulcatus]
MYIKPPGTCVYISMGAKRAARSGLPAPSSVLLRASPPFCFVCVNPFRSNKRTVHAPLFMARGSPMLKQIVRRQGSST